MLISATMALEQPQLRLTTDLPREKSLKRGKSLSRSISAVFRKSNKSHPTSPSLLPTPPTPHVPAEFRPQTASARTPSDLALPVKRYGDEEVVAQGAIGVHQQADDVLETKSQIHKSTSLQPLSTRHSRQPSWTSGDDSTRPQTASPADTTLPVNDAAAVGEKKLKPKKSFRASSSKTSNLDRFTSATMPLPASPTSPHTSSHVPRPATFGATLPTPNPNNLPSRTTSAGDGAYRPSPDSFEVPPSPRLPWSASQNAHESRSSVRSAVTAASSRTTTTRNSVLTKETAMTDVTVDPNTRLEIKEERKSNEGMTVDEAIDMYVAGFTDDVEELPVNDTLSPSEEESRRSAKIAEAIDGSISPGDPPKSPASSTRPSTSSSTRPKSSRSRSFSQSTLTHGTTFPYGPSRDQYGFLKYNHYITRSAYDAWFADYWPQYLGRCRKWVMYLKENKLPTENPTKFPPRSLKTQRYIRKG